MKKIVKTTIITLLLLLSYTSVNSEGLDAEHSHQHAVMNNSDMNHGSQHKVGDKSDIESTGNVCSGKVEIKVSGLVCDFCARALEKVFAKQDGVDSIDVDLNTGHVGIQIKDGSALDKAVLSKLIIDSGYNIREIVRGCQS